MVQCQRRSLFDTFLEALLYNSSPIIRNFHLNFKIIPAGSAYRAGKTAKKSSTYVKNPLFPTVLAHRHRCPAFQNPVFSRLHYSPHFSNRPANVNSEARPQFFRLTPAKAQGTALVSCLWLGLCYNEYPVGCEHFPPLRTNLFAAHLCFFRPKPSICLQKQVETKGFWTNWHFSLDLPVCKLYIDIGFWS